MFLWKTIQMDKNNCWQMFIGENFRIDVRICVKNDKYTMDAVGVFEIYN